MTQRINGPEIGKLARALQDAFPERNDFSDLLHFRLDRRYVDFEKQGDRYKDVVKNVVVDANAKYWLNALVREARNAVPNDPQLMALAEPLGLAPALVSGDRRAIGAGQLELKIRKSESTFDIVTWRKRLAEIEGRVCRVELPLGTAKGTGFLIGPNAVLTNYHVVEEVCQGDRKSSDLNLRFDYKVLDDGVAVAKGLVCNLANDWLYDWSPYSAEDLKVDPHPDPQSEELDYAILRTSIAVGQEPVGGNSNDPNSTNRGWVQLPTAQHNFVDQKALYIVQHPDGKPMQVAIDSEAVVGVNGNATRVRYTTTTEPGSSGSPCFGSDWEWIAIHHSGDPKYALGRDAEYNEGIPTSALQGLVKKRGKQAVFGGSI